MRRFFLALAALVVLLGGSAVMEAAEPAKDEFTVLTFSPQGIVKGKPSIEIAFSGPVVKKDAVGKTVPSDKVPLSFFPPVRGAGKWSDESTFLFVPSRAFPPATLFRATARETLTDLKGRRLVGKQSFEFSTEPLKLLQIQQTAIQDNDVTLELSFNLPVSPFRLRGFLSVQDEKDQQLGYSVQQTAPSKTLYVTTTVPSDRKKLSLRFAAGLSSDVGPLGMDTDTDVAVTVDRTLEIRGTSVRIDEPGRALVTIGTSMPVDMAALPKFVSVEPKREFTVESSYNGFSIVGDFASRERIAVTLRKGLPARDGTKLRQDFTQSFIFPDMDAGLRFPTAGSVLSPAGDLLIPIETVNAETVTLNLWRVYENNIPVSMLSSYTIPRDLARLVVTRKAHPGGALNTVTRKSIDLRELAGDAKGVFLLTAELDNDYWNTAEQLVSVTDLGIVSRVFRNGVTIWVNSILNAKPVEGASVRVYSRSNQVVASGTTDGNGLWTWHDKEPWDEQLTPALVTVEKDGDLSYLKLEANLLDDSSFDTSGKSRSAGYEALLFTPRGIFRPGEKVDFSVVVRDEKWLPPKPFPVLYVIRSSMGREVNRGTAMLSEEGTGSFGTILASIAPTGAYTAIVCLPGKEDTPIGQTSFFVEDFVAPRLEVQSAGDKPFMVPGDEITISVSSAYLFGAPAAGLPFEGELRATSAPFRPEGWASYTFGDTTKTFEGISEFLEGGELDDTGKGTLTYSTPEGLNPPAAVNLRFISRVMEESGRWVNSSLLVPFHAYPLYIGIEAPKGEILPGKETAVRVAAVTPEGDASGAASLKAELLRVERHYNLVQVGSQSRYQVQRELVPQYEGEVILKEGIGTYAFTPKSEGEFLLRFTDPDSGSTGTMSMWVWAPYGTQAGSGSTLLDRVVITTDSGKYVPGDTASVTFRSPFQGNLLVTVETDRDLFTKVFSMTTGEMNIEIPVTADMIPNAYITAWLLRPVKEGEPWGSHRALGTIPLFVDYSDKKLDVTLDVPERTLPGEPLNVKGVVKNMRGTPRKGEVVLFLVDEGILGLTGYKTPDPWEFFMGKRAIGASVYDLYDNLLPLEGRNTPLLKTGGGAGEDAMMAMRAAMSPLSARDFNILALYKGVLATDENGAFTATVDIPEFSGKGRLMAVAVSKDFFGSGEKAVTIARDVTTELSLPRAVSPGDSFSAPLKIFSSAEEPRAVTVTVSVDGPLAIQGETTFTADLPGKGSDALLTVPFTASGEGGMANLEVATSWENGSSKQKLNLPVRPAYPRVALSGSGVATQEKQAAIAIPREWFRGTEEGKLLLSGLPSLDLLGAASFLTNYPHGCLEQTVSGAWPYLVLPDIVGSVSPSLVNEEANRAALAARIRQISAMQVYDGGFSKWPGISNSFPWGSVYATHFLVEAKRGGAEVPEDLLNNALSYVRYLLPLSPNDASSESFRENMTLKAYASYVLALAGDAPLGWMAHIKENSDSLRDSGSTFLCGAYALSTNTAEPLAALGTEAPSLRRGESSTFESPSRSQALKLLMWTAVDPLAPTAAQLAAQLIEGARQNAWNTTQDNAMAVLALGRWLEKTKESRKPFTAVLRDESGTELASFGEDSPVTMDFKDLPKGPLTLTVSGEGTSYYAWTSAGVPVEAPKPSSNGITVSRQWAGRDGKKLAPNPTVQQGDQITVTLSLKPSAPMSDLVVVDMLPGGMEIDNPRLSGAEDEKKYYGVRSEMRDDRLVLFIDSLTKPMEYKYVIRAVSKGTFTVPPLAAEGMYAPDRSAVTSAGTVTIR